MSLRVVIAAYDGRCGLCGDAITADTDEIVNIDGEWCHAQCAEDEGEDVQR